MWRSAGMKARPCARRCCGPVGGDVVGAGEVDAARQRPENAHQDLGELGLAVAADAGDPVDLAGPHGEARAGRARHGRRRARPRSSATVRIGSPISVDGAGTSVTLLPTIIRVSSGDRDGARIGGGDGLAAAHHRHPVGMGDDLAELVGDEHDGGAARRDARGSVRSRRSDSWSVSTAVGSSRIRMRGAADQHLQDLDPLLLGDRQHADRLVEVDLEAERLAVRPHLVGDLLGARGR